MALAGLSVAIVGYGVSKLAKAGLFQRVLFDVKPVPSDKVWLVKSYKGKYNDIHTKFQALFKVLGDNKSWDETVGIYYDDPQEAGANNCRYAIGLCIPASADKLQELLINNGYATVTIEKDLPALHCTFPFEGMLSVWLSLFKVYTACDKEMKKRGWQVTKDAAVVEITRLGVTEFYFMLDVSKQLMNIRAQAISS